MKKLKPISLDHENRYRDNLNPNYLLVLCYERTLSDKFIEEFFNRMPMDCLCRFQKLSENFIKKHRRDIDWAAICHKQQLSEKFMRENIKYLRWALISEFQKFSFRFAWLMRRYIRPTNIYYNCNLSDQFKKRYSRMIQNELDSRIL